MTLLGLLALLIVWVRVTYWYLNFKQINKDTL
jgi:hypothetical protein